MLVSEIMGSRARMAPTRRVVVEYPPTEQYRVMSAAVELYHELGVDIHVEGLRISVPCGAGAAGPLLGVIERCTGHTAFTERQDAGS